MPSIKRILISFVFVVFVSSTGFAQSAGVADRFSAYDPNSTVRINHGPLSDYLEATVFPIGRSYRILGNEKADSYRGSRIKTSKPLSPSRFEGSRLFIHAFSEDHKVFFRSYQQGLENLSTRRSLNTLNKSEQLAFWLNLYNVIVINKLVKEYPIQKLKSFRSTKRGKKSFWTSKVTTIEGVPLSLTDIEKILFANFDAPEVAFGLWQGSIGGPRLLNEAYTGTNVKRALENNALEFVNSNRGLRPPTGSRMNVSDFYEWMMPAFGTSPDHVLLFIKEYADPNFVSGVSSVSSLNFKLYDWTIADLLGGNKHTGTSNQLGGVLTGRSEQVGTGAVGISVGEESGGTKSTFSNFYNMAKGAELPSVAGLPDSAINLIMGVVQNTRRPTPIITTTECAPGEDCTVENIDIDGS